MQLNFVVMPAGRKRASRGFLDSPVKPENDKNVSLLITALVYGSLRPVSWNRRGAGERKPVLAQLIRDKFQIPPPVLKWTMSEEKSKLVYSTDKLISRKEKPVKNSVKPKLNPVHQKVIVRLDRKLRGGKSVTVIEGLQIPKKDREALLKELKAGLGAGGTVTDTSLEIQGDHCDALITALTKMGYRPKRSGG